MRSASTPFCLFCLGGENRGKKNLRVEILSHRHVLPMWTFQLIVLLNGTRELVTDVLEKAEVHNVVFIPYLPAKPACRNFRPRDSRKSLERVRFALGRGPPV